VPGADPITTLVTPETFVLNNGVMDASTVAARIDGPRDNTADVADLTWIWQDRFGAPRIVQDALGSNHYIFHDDARFPALATSTNAPGASFGGATTRMVARAYYNPRGTLDSTVVVNPLGPNADGTERNAKTVVAYDAAWPDFVSRVTSPTGLVTTMGYDAATGNRLWQQVGPDASRRVNFGYNTLGQVTSVRSQRAIAAGDSAETMEYTSPLGNLTAVVSPLLIRTTYQQDGLGRDTLVTSPADSVRDVYGITTGTLLYQKQKTRYDALDRVIATVTLGPQMDFSVPSSSTATPWATIPAESVVVNNLYTNGLLTSVSRTAWPDSAGIGTITTAYRYNALGRKVAEVSAVVPGAPADSVVYDAAGNVIQSVTRRGKIVSFTYDALGRLKHRSVPAETVGTDTKTNVPGITWYFPYFVNNGTGALEATNTGSGSLTVPGEEADFTYDAAGNLTRAVNGDAVVSRRYFPNGLLRADTLKIRTYTGTDTTSHVYGLTYAYDLEGRRTELDVPTNIAPWPNSAFGQTYHYDSTTGALDGIGYTTTAGSYGFSYTYDAEGRLSTFTRNGFQESHYYDADGRDTLRTEVKVSSGWQMHRDRTRYDLRGKQLRIATPSDSTVNGFSGLGTLARSYHDAYSNAEPDQNESYTQDALGNQFRQRQSSLGGNQFQFDAATPITRRVYQPGTGRLIADSTGTSDSYMAGLGTTGYDEAGNRTWYYDSHGVSTPYPDSTYSSGGIIGHIGSCSSGCETASTSPATYTEWTRSWYGADEKLRFVDRRTCYVFQPDGHSAACNPNKEPMPSARPAFEEYRYDALGRRILVRSRQHYACTTRCQSTLRRIVWDGDQVLAEIQAPGYTGTSAATMEQDVGFRVAAASILVADTSAVPVTTTSTYYPGYYFGRVLYTHGPGIDHPLAMMRMEYSDSLPGPITIYPHENWKGAYDLGSYDGQSLNAPCKIVGYRNGTHTEFQTWVPGPGETSSPPDTLYNCLKVDWPAPHLWLTNRIRENSQVGAESWNGSLVDGMRDATGLTYMRNRYYDPASGRFTQEDPIRIAGGLNVYGFANGDPVSYADPYGLKASGSVLGWLRTRFRRMLGYKDKPTVSVGEPVVVAVEASGTFAVADKGVTAGAGVILWSSRGPGVSLTTGKAAGLDISGSVGATVASNLSTYEGQTRSVCAGYGPGGGCAGANDSGEEVNGGLSFSPAALAGLPSFSVKETNTKVFTTADARDAVFWWSLPGINAILNTGLPPR
jgi:RHS repeat-associated protein